MVYNFLCKDEKTRRNIYLLLLKTSVLKEVRHFFRTVYPNRNHVTTHPDFYRAEPARYKTYFLHASSGRQSGAVWHIVLHVIHPSHDSILEL